MIERNVHNLLFLRLKKLGYHLIRVKIIDTNKKKTLQIMAERIKDKLMSIEDCTFLSRHISTVLEVEDPISSSYILEVSSGGIARPLTSLNDYSWYTGNMIKLTFKEPYMGKKSYKGFLSGVNKEDLIILKNKDYELLINIDEIEKAHIDFNWAIDNKN